MGPMTRVFTDYMHAKVATDSEFKTYARLYAYDKLPLNAIVESSKEEPYWTKQKINLRRCLQQRTNDCVPVST